MTSPTKPSGIPWLDEVPAHWEVKRLKDIADVRFSNVDKKTEEGEIPVRLCNYTDVYYGHYLDGTPAYMEASATRSEIERFKLRKGDVLITKDSESPTDIAIAAMVVEDVPDLVCGYHLAMIRADHDQIEPAFLYWQLLSDQVREQYYPLANGITRFALGHGEINGGAFVLPPLPEQRAIAAFLDERTARIDALVARKRRLVQLLKEKRQALITRAVTRGLDPKAKMKESGVPWLGEVPEGWEVKELKYMIGPMEQGWSPQCDNYPAEEGEWGVLKAGCVNGPTLNESENKRLPDHEKPIPSLEIKPGDILMSRANTVDLIGSCGYVEQVRPRLILCDKLYRFHALPGVSDGRYLVYFLRSRAGRSYMEQNTSGASDSMQNIGQDIVRNIVMPCPPIKEQEAIVAYITEQTARLDTLVTKVEEAVERLQEYRTALISAAVTGKVRVG